jgi:cell fate (sporulation/competence/biofilm development) regulator YlbF (YheA/YmcA/DUF963 family)
MMIQSLDQTAEIEAATHAAEAESLLAAGTFGTALRASPEFVRLLAAGASLGADDAAQEAIDAFNTLQSELRLEIRMGVLDAAQRANLQRVQATMLAFPTVSEYVAAQTDFEGICRETAALVTSEIGVDFAANCRSGGCCGG